MRPIWEVTDAKEKEKVVSGIDKQLYYKIEDLFFAADHLAGVARDLTKEVSDPQIKAVLHRSRINFSSTALILEEIVKEGLGDEQE